jgi:flagellar protein FlgJ
MTAVRLDTPQVASTTAPASAGAASAKPQGQRAQLAAAAKQFEAIFVRQMLASARKTDFGGSSLFDSEALGTFRQMQDERFADIASERGAFGMAKMIEARLAQMMPASSEPQEGNTNGV